MDISVIICTYNRAHNLRACLEHLTAQERIENLDWEVVVVDNNSTDDTAGATRALARDLPVRVRYLFEQRQGLSHARNCGIEGTDSCRVAFIDDDILVSPGWVAALWETFLEHDCDAVGGRIEVDSPLSLPRWIRPEMYGFLGQQDYGDEPLPLDGVNRFPFGGNMAFHRRVFQRIGLFDTELGRRGTGARREDLFKGEETDFFGRLAGAGGTIRYQPGASVRHRILPYQLRRRFFLTIHYNEGYQRAKLDPQRFQRTLRGVPLFVYPQAARALGQYLRQTLWKGPDQTVRQLMTVAYFLGMVRGYADRPNASGSDLPHQPTGDRP